MKAINGHSEGCGIVYNMELNLTFLRKNYVQYQEMEVKQIFKLILIF